MLGSTWTRPRLLATAAATAAVLACGLAPASPAASPSCKGRSLVKGGLIKVVDRGRGPRAHRYVACARGDASVARRLRGTRTGARLEFLDSRGAMLAVRDPGSRAVTVWNVAGKERVRLRSGGRDPVGPVVVAHAGEAAAQFRTGSRTALVGFDYDGTGYTLDTGAVRSLRGGKRSRISWMKGGKRRTADLSEPAIPCADLGGKRVLRTDQVNIVSFTYDGEFLQGELDGRITRTRGCALPGGPVRLLGVDITSTDVEGGAAYRVLASEGTFILEQDSFESSDGESQLSYRMRDLGTGKRVDIYGNSAAGGPNEELGEPAGVPVVSSTGQAASAFATDTGGEQIVAFDPAGKPRVLDTAPSENEIDENSLTLSGTTLSWLHGGQPRTADLAGP